ncbi:MAG: dihydropteroate synthase [Deltaproteobacteria bacterium]|nr:MAG: dihydropteroate synthase [Deltaproteobacteria bacterium]
MGVTPAPLALPRGGQLSFSRVRVMGVLNVTPDSFSDGGRFFDVDSAVARGHALVAAGADILDIGGESTRPGSAPVPAEEQIRRTVPVIARLAAETAAPISIDTTSAVVARAALAAGAHIVNDISAFRFDEAMIPLLAETGAPSIAMHTLAAPSVMQDDPRYGDVVADVVAHLRERVARCVAAGVARSQIVLDPGIGFGKTVAHNLALLAGLPELAALGHAVLVGTSRKSFLGQLTGRPVDAREMATAGSVAASIVLGAHIVRVHDVDGLRDAIIVADAIAHGERT